MKYLLISILLIFVVCFPQKSNAQSLTCTIAPVTLAFGTVNVLSGSPSYASSNVTATCNGHPAHSTVYVCLGIGSGTGGGTTSNRLLSSGTSTIPIEFRDSPSATTQIGNGTSYPQEGPFAITLNPNTATINFPITGIIRPQGTLPLPGTYTSVFSGTQFQVIGTTTNSTTCAQVAASSVGISTGSMTASATIINQCTVSSTPMNFGTASVISTAINATATVGVSCNASTSFTVALDNGGYGTSPTARAMASGSNRVTYAIYSDSARTLAWGNTTGSNTVASSVTGASTGTITAFGSVSAQTGAPPGAYADVVNVTVSY